MPKSNATHRHIDDDHINALIRHHLEEASTHLGMVKQLAANGIDDRGLTKVGHYLNTLYVRYGGYKDA